MKSKDDELIVDQRHLPTKAATVLIRLLGRDGTVGQVCRTSDQRLLAQRGFGLRLLAETRRLLGPYRPDAAPPRCLTCRFWQRHKDDEWIGHCKHPAPARQSNRDEPDYRTGVWPVTQHSDWCGQWLYQPPAEDH